MAGSGKRRRLEELGLPGWLSLVNPVVAFLQRLGLVVGPMCLISVPGRRSGRMRTTPVSLLVVDGRRYVVAGTGEADWVENARRAGWAILSRGRREERVRLVELPVEERAPILREFPEKVPGGVTFFRRLYGISGSPEEFAGLAPRCPVFRIEGGKMV